MYVPFLHIIIIVANASLTKSVFHDTSFCDIFFGPFGPKKSFSNTQLQEALGASTAEELLQSFDVDGNEAIDSNEMQTIKDFLIEQVCGDFHC